MKRILNTFLLPIGLMVLVATSCKKQFDINQSPNSLEKPPINTVLTNVTVNVGFAGGNDLLRFPGLWVQQYAAQGPTGNSMILIENYNLLGQDLISVWAILYANTLMDNEYILNNSAGHPYYNGIAKIIKAWCFQHIVDMWGDVPFSEALKIPQFIHPHFDDDATIYPQLITLLNEGIAQLNQQPMGLIPGSNETIYNGNRQKWIRMANTLKMRIALHYSEIDPGKTKTEIDALISAAAPVIDDNANNFQMVFIDAPNSQNSIHQFEVRRPNQLFPNAYLVNLMNAKSDPRRNYFFTPYPYTTQPSTATYKGAKPGDAQAFNYSRFNTYLRGALKNTPTALPDGSLSATAAVYTGAAPIRLLTAAEYYFIRAEASLRFGAIGDAQQLFQSAIRKSMQDAGVPDPAISNYLTQYGILTGTVDEQLKKLIEEKYVALYGVALEPYNDWRRTGYPAIVKVPNAILPSIPTIFYYANHELGGNPNGQQKASLLEKVFWDR